MDVSSRRTYAISKYRSIVQDHEEEITPVRPTVKHKVVVLGNSGVGKTSIVYRHKYGNDLAPCSATIGASFISVEINIEENLIRMQIWDTAGQERFRCMVPMYMRDAAAAIIVFDITCRKSFDDVEKWIHELDRCASQLDPILVIIGNKCDLTNQRKVATGEGMTKAMKHNAQYYETSAFDANAIDEVLVSLATSFLKTSAIKPVVERPEPILLCRQDEFSANQRHKKCCNV